MYTTNTFIHEYLNHRNRDQMYTPNTFIHEYLNHRNRDKMYTPNTIHFVSVSMI
jgi:hypothetical protein